MTTTKRIQFLQNGGPVVLRLKDVWTRRCICCHTGANPSSVSQPTVRVQCSASFRHARRMISMADRPAGQLSRHPRPGRAAPARPTRTDVGTQNVFAVRLNFPAYSPSRLPPVLSLKWLSFSASTSRPDDSRH